MPPWKSRCLGRESGELPEPIMQHILSFLDYTDAVRASAVSKAWKSALSTLQCLKVSDNPIEPLNKDSYRYDSDEDELNVRAMFNSAGGFVSKASNRNLHVQKFCFEIRGIYSSFVMVQGLIRCLNISGCDHIEEFAFEVRNVRSKYKLPRSLFAARSLHKLVLLGLELSLSDIDGINLPALESLEIRYIRIDNGFLEQLLMNCPELESLKLHNCHGFHAFKVLGSHHKLKRVDFEKNSEEEEEEDCFVSHGPAVQIIEIKEAPNLEYLRYCSNAEDRLNILDVAACKNLKVLELSAICGDDMLLNSIELLVSQLKVLETFKLHDFLWTFGEKGSKSITISSNSLRELWLAFVELPMNVQVDVPHLSEFLYMGLISSNLSFGASPKTAVNFVKCKVDRIRCDKLVEFLRSFNHFEAVKLDDFAPRHFKVLKRLGHNLDPPLWDVKHLNVGMYDSDKRCTPGNLEMLEGLLWMAPQLDTLTFDNIRPPITFQFVHENSRNVEKVPFITRRNILIKIKVESCPGDIEGFELKKYLFKFDDGKSSVSKAEEDLDVVQVMTKTLW